MQTKQATIMRAPCAGARAARTFLPPALLHALEGGHRRSGAYQQRDERTARLGWTINKGVFETAC